MPVSFSSPARNLFLLGSSGRQAVTNFFESISKASTTDGVFIPDEIRYIADNKKYALSGSAADSNSKGFGWLERQDYNLETGSLTTDYSNRIESTLNGVNTTLRAMELDSNNNLIVVGFSGTTPWIAKYSNDGVLDWQSTSNSANVRYLGVTSDSNNNYYACGRTSYALPDTQAFVEKFDSNGNPGWGKSAFMLGRDVVLAKISANDRGEVVAVGFLEDDSAQKGYIVKIDTNTGEVLWDRTLERNISGYGGFALPSSGDDITPADVKCTACYIDSNDQIYVVGSIDGKGTNDNGVGEFLIKYSPEGNIIWQRERNTRDYINAPGGAPNTVPFDVKSDGETEQTVVLSVDSFATAASIELSKYSKSGDLVFRRRINKSGGQLGAASLDADPSFYYFIFRDQEVDGLAGEPDRYTFGKVSTSGNGLGAFQYADGTPTIVDYTISSDTENKIGRMSDGSVTNSVSDLMTYPFTANQVVFDDLATHVSNKKRQMDDADSFEYSGSPAIRPADFQELNLLGDVYSGSGDWLDQSGKGNDAVVEFTTTTTTGGTTESENFRTVTSSYSTYGTVAENTVTNDLPYNNADWSHYGGKVRDLQTGGFRIDLTGNSNGGDFFMACWIKFDTYAVSRQMGIDLFGGYVYWETLANGAIAVRHNGGNRADSSATSLNDGNWHHIALSRTGGTLYGMLDGSTVISTTSGVSGASVNSNENFWFFGGSGTSYNVDAKILDPIVCIGTGVSGYSVPTEPVIDANGTFPNAAPHVPFFSNNWAYISPAVSLGGTTTTTTNGPTHNAAGYWDFDGTDDKIIVNDLRVEELGETFTVETWIYPTDFAAPSGSPGDAYPRRIMSTHRSTGSTKWCLGIDTSGRLGFGGSQGIEEPVGNKYQLSLNTYYHVMLVHDGTEYTLYVDGIERANNTSSPIDAANDTQDPSLCIGGRPHAATDRVYKGRIGGVRAYLRPLTAAQVFQSYNATKSKYINEAPDTAPKIGPGIVYGSNLLLNYDFGNRATYDRVENLYRWSNNFSKTGDALEFWNVGGTYLPKSGPNGEDVWEYTLTQYTGAQEGEATLQQRILPNYPAGTVTTQRWLMRSAPGYGTQTVYHKHGRNAVYGVNQANVEFDITEEWSEITTTDSVYTGNTKEFFGIGTVNAGVVVQIASAQLWVGSENARYVDTYGVRITAPTTVKNLSSSSYTGTINGGATFNSAGYFDFDAVDGYIDTGYNPGAVTELTVEAWLRVDTYTNDGAGISIGTNQAGTGQCYLGRGNSGGDSMDWRFYTGTFLDETEFFTSDTGWKHYVGTYDQTGGAGGNQGRMRLYVDGNLEDTALSNNTSAIDFSSGENIRIGVNTNGSSYFDGKFGEIRIYDKALTATEVSQNFNATRGKYGV